MLQLDQASAVRQQQINRLFPPNQTRPYNPYDYWRPYTPQPWPPLPTPVVIQQPTACFCPNCNKQLTAANIATKTSEREGVGTVVEQTRPALICPECDFFVWTGR